MMPGDREWMEQALALGALGTRTRPNPRVGCVLVRDGRVVGQGFHRVAGEAHAEAIAVDQAGGAARGATAYVNLEPCAHEGRTPPCAELLARAGVVRVVAALRDPNPLVDGRGFEQLREAGIAVDVGLLSHAAERLNAPFLHWHRVGRPWVTVKVAATLDGMIAAGEGRSRWITGPAARRFAHRLRSDHDAILVGAETVRRDDPRLTVRLPGVQGGPLRAVLTRRMDLSPSAAVLEAGPPSTARTRIYTGEPSSPDWSGVAEVVRLPAVGDGLDLGALLADLARVGVQALLVEGGGRTVAGFLEAGLVDRVAWFLSARLFGARGATPAVDGTTVSEPQHGPCLGGLEQLALGDDQLLIGHPGPRGS